MVILMGVRLDRYNEKRRKKSRGIYRFSKIFITILLFTGFIIAVINVNTSIRELNYIDNTTLFNMDFENRMITIFGRKYIIEIDKVVKLIKPD